MDFDLRLKALTRLAQSETDAAKAALRKEFEKAHASLAAETQYDRLRQDLDVLDVIGYRFSTAAVQSLVAFIESIQRRAITYSALEGPIGAEIRTYQNASALIVRALEVLIKLRYLETHEVLRTLLNLSVHDSERVRKQAVEGLKVLAGYSIEVFYGHDEEPGLGAKPQQEISGALEALEDNDIKTKFSAVLTLIESLLSPTMHGASWSYKAVTLSRTATPPLPAVADIRRRAITLLKRMYALTSTESEKLKVIGALNLATRVDIESKRGEVSNMVERDAREVLDFFSGVVRSGDLPIIQKIESDAYWIFYHATSSEIETAALSIYTAIDALPEYKIYKTLIGFEGIFGDWKELRQVDVDWEKIEKSRKEKALQFALSINATNYADWRQRIVKYAETQSEDLATFPIFYFFLESFAAAQPELALRLISEESGRMEDFLIPLLRGLSAGKQSHATKRLIESWIKDGKYLYQSTRHFLARENIDRDLLARLLRRASELEDLHTVAAVVSVVVSNFTKESKYLISDFFIPALKVMTQHSSANWIFDAWFRREMKELIRCLDENEVEEVLRNLLALEKIDYHAEEILSLIAERAPNKVLNFLCERLIAQTKDEKAPLFDAIPYEMHKLNEPLARIPREVVRKVRGIYDGNYSRFIFGGAHLLKTIFPKFDPEFEGALISLVKTGGNLDLEFVLAALRNYEGQPFIHEVCKAIVGVVPSDSSYLTEVAVALESTGVVSGEFGLVDAYERKKSEVKEWLNDPDEKIQNFTRSYIATLEKMIVTERRRAEEEISLRKHRYGEQ